MATRELVMSGGGPWGFTLSGGKDFRSPLKVSKITPGGKAAKGGIRFGDYIIAINGESTENVNHSDAMMLIKTTGMDLRLTVTKEPPAGAGGDSRSGGESTDAGGRPQPPPVPTTTKTPIRQQVTISTASFSNTPKSPKSPEPKTQPSTVVPDSGLGTGGSSTIQSPAFKKIHVDNKPTPSVLGGSHPSPPTQAMKNIVIDDGNVRKTSERPPPPSNAPSKVTMSTVKVPKGSPIPKPAPPPTSSQPTSTPAAGESTTAKAHPRQGVCSGCNEPIRGPYASAMGRVWHPEHFTCSKCQKTLQNTTFVFEDEQIICEDCYSSNAQTCHSCHKHILGPCVSAVGLHWHQEHFTCSRCNADLSKGEGFNMENNLLFCADCFGSLYGATCSGCGGKIGGGELWVEALDGTWHSGCFVCEACKNPLEGSTFFAKAGRPYCKNCA